MRVTSHQYLALGAISRCQVHALRQVQNPNKFTLFGTVPMVLNTLMERGWVQEILVSTTTKTYTLTDDGYKAYAKLKKTKPKQGAREI